ncbi:glutamate racemase [Candidatus Parcubacteria bacterium]|jgi:glutamate racemase|nr:glutamate racemase [Candidatus Parcubacteria bacterium]
MIGVFDSGFGGLTIFKDIETSLPQYNYIYLGDNARAPYGNSDQETIYEYTKQAVDYLFGQGCNLIILACNTASAGALRRIQQEHLPDKYPGKNVLGVIRPLVEEVSQMTKNKIVAVMGTLSTVKSRTYIEEFLEQDGSIDVMQQACPLLVPLIEKSWENRPEVDLLIREYVAELKDRKPDIVVLGCTHYGFVHDLIQEHFGKRTRVLDSGVIVAKKLADYLKKHYDLVPMAKGKPKRIFLTTNSRKIFDQAAEKFLGRQIKSKKVKII